MKYEEFFDITSITTMVSDVLENISFVFYIEYPGKKQ